MLKKKRGRPPLDNPANTKLPTVRLEEEQLAQYRTAALKKDETLSAWVRRHLDRASKRELNK